MIKHSIQGIEFEWDPRKATKNLRKHRTSFIEAATVFKDSFSVTSPDPDHSEDEDRNIIVRCLIERDS